MPKRLFKHKTELQIIDIYNTGINAPELSNQWNCSIATIYNILRRHKCPPRPPGFQKQDPTQTFHRHYKILPNACWQWTGFITPNGYGRVYIYHGPKRIKGNRSRKMAHRFSYELKYGKIPTGKQMHHICHNKACVNPDHLQITTKHAHPLLHTNTITGINARKTHCIRNHPLFGKNLYTTKTGGRVCRTCHNFRKKHNVSE